MKRFVARMLLFWSIPISIVALWSVFVVAIDRCSYLSALQLPKGCDVVVCSDSHTQNGLDPAFMPRLYNFSSAASLPDQNLLRLEDILVGNPGKVRIVLIDVTPLHVGFDERQTPLSEAGAARVHALLHVYHWRETERPWGNVPMLFRDVMLDRKFNELRKALRKKRRLRSSLAGGFYAVKSAGFVDAPGKAADDVSKKAQRINACPKLKQSDRIVEILEKSIDVTRSFGAEPVFITTPLSTQLRKALDPEKSEAFIKVVTAFAATRKIPYLNYFYEDFPIGSWRDANHLNLAGAEAFTKRVAGDLEGLMR